MGSCAGFPVEKTKTHKKFTYKYRRHYNAAQVSCQTRRRGGGGTKVKGQGAKIRAKIKA